MLLAKAETQAGTPYVWGGAAPGGFDCSGLIYWAAMALGVQNMPRDTYSMLAAAGGLLVQTDTPEPGDLAFFGSEHVELYVSPGVFFGAQQTGTLVGFHDYGTGYVPTAYYYVS
jgi:cell wall-associated NlpC family hydrolase